MEFMEWAVEVATKHPELRDAFVQADGDWLDVLLEDGRSFRFRPAALIRPSVDEGTRRELLSRLITIAIEQAEVGQAGTKHTEATRSDTLDDSADATGSDLAPRGGVEHNPPAENDGYPCLPRSMDIKFHSSDSFDQFLEDAESEDGALIVPIVRNASYFLQSHTDDDSLAYIPLTDFIGVGLAYDLPHSIQPVKYSELEAENQLMGDSLAQAVQGLRQLTYLHHHAIEVRHFEIAGAEVLAFMQPPNYESSWMADVEMMHEIAERLTQMQADAIPLFIPAAPTKLYLVSSTDPHLADFFALLLSERDFDHGVYPLPHTIAADGWREWIPFPGSRLAEVLGALRNAFREEIYRVQGEVLYSWSDAGAVKNLHSRRLASGERVSVAEWNSLDRQGSIPDADFVSFVRDPSPHPWEPDNSVRVTVRLVVARDVWPEGLKKMDGVWPPRWQVAGFPDDSKLRELQAAAGREF
ncbi:MAG: hypothetical protein SPI14_00170 [Arcanobacterium sp.]|nr:hypothetical protein [Arcanobacterium sp.]